jgi:beta-barrel assembly-enhancing protease
MSWTLPPSNAMKASMTSSELFEGGVFEPNLPTGRSGARLHLDTAHLVAETPSGECLYLALDRCRLSLGGASGRMVFCRDDTLDLTLFSEAPGFLKALTECDVPTVQQAARSLVEDNRKHRRRTLRLLGLGLILAALVLFGLYQLAGSAASFAVSATPISIDARIGEIALSSMDLKGPRTNDRALTNAMTKIVDRLQPHAKLKDMTFSVTIVDASIVNAFCLPGGRIVVYTGLIRKAQKPEQVAAVLAHEIAHATLRHGLMGVLRSVGIVGSVQLLVGDVGGLAALAIELAQAGVLTSYSRSQEAEADHEGLRMMYEGHLEGRAMAEFFVLLREEQGDMPDELSWLASHPQLSDRVKAIEATWAERDPGLPAPLGIDWADVQAHAKDPGS